MRRGRDLGTLAGLGVLSALWALFLWTELVRSRAGAEPFCGFGESSGCSSLWEGSFASSVLEITGLPVAAWGLLWALLATAAPLLALALRVDGGEIGRSLSAVKLLGAAGAASVVVLIVASSLEGSMCRSCVVTQALALGYGALAFYRLREAQLLAGWRPLLSLLVSAVVLYLVFLIPDTPSQDAVGERARAALESSMESPEAPSSRADDESRRQASEELSLFVSSLGPELRQGLSDTLALYAGAKELPYPSSRDLVGAADAKVRITVFSDARCSHCAQLHEGLEDLLAVVPLTRFSIDSRQFPLDGRCNSKLGPRNEDMARCLAARAQICMEPEGRAFDFSGEVLSHHGELTEELVMELAEAFLPRDRLDICLASPETSALLEEDIELAWRLEPRGTPLVVVNGREGSPFPPFLYAIVLAEGDPGHPAFEDLPPARPELP